jgi:hypothetical protein
MDPSTVFKRLDAHVEECFQLFNIKMMLTDVSTGTDDVLEIEFSSMVCGDCDLADVDYSAFGDDWKDVIYLRVTNNNIEFMNTVEQAGVWFPYQARKTFPKQYEPIEYDEDSFEYDDNDRMNELVEVIMTIVA